MSTTFTPPSPPPPSAVIYGASTTPYTPPYIATSSPSSSSSSTSIIIVIIIISSAVIVSATIYLLLRFLSRRFHRSFRTAADDVVLHSPNHHSNPQCHVAAPDNNLLDSLPLFTFRSVTGNLTGGDCAVCLSKFEPYDQLRLLPLCCHAFHSDCIDAWIVSNSTCPLCRSTVTPSDADVLDKILSTDNQNRNGNGSFRIEIGSISRRHGGAAEAQPESDRRSYSIGSFDYIVDENGYEVSVGSTVHRRGASDCNSIDKESLPEPQSEFLAAEVSGGRNWLREYMDRLASVSISSRAMSFRSSGRFFSGSSRRTETVIDAEDLEANRVGEEISELFRWLSGV